MKRILMMACLLAGLVAPPAWAAAYDVFLKIEGVDGESSAKGHEKWVDVLRWDWGVHNTGGSSGGSSAGGGKAVFDDFSWVQRLDSSVVDLFKLVSTGKFAAKATLDVATTGAGAYTFFQMEFDGVSPNKLNMQGSGADTSVFGAFGYDKVTLRYRPQDQKGTPGKWIEGVFDVKKNKGAFVGDENVILGLFSAGGNVSVDTIVRQVPEPAAMALMAIGLLGIGIGMRRRQRP